MWANPMTGDKQTNKNIIEKLSTPFRGAFFVKRRAWLR